MVRLIFAAMLAGLALPAAAQEAAPASEAACVEAGGRWERAGLAWRLQCILPTPDAGAPCEKADDCTGYCLAETRTCSTETPIYGCFALLDLDGAVVTLCID